MVIYLLFLTISLTQSTLYTFSDVNISITSNTIGNLALGGYLYETCQKIIARDNAIYHLSSINIYQSWLKSSFANLDTINISATTHDFFTDLNQERVVFETSNLGIARHKIFNLFDNFTLEYDSEENQDEIADRIFFIEDKFYKFYASGTSGNSEIKRIDMSTGAVEQIKDLEGDYFWMEICFLEGNLKAVVWSFNSVAKFYSLPSMTLETTFVPDVLSDYETKKVFFSADWSMMIFESNNKNPVYIFNMTNN